MFKRLLETIRSEKELSATIRAQLVDGLFHPFASLISGAVAGLFIAAVLSFTANDQLVVNLAYAVVLIALGRIALGVYYLRSGQPVTPHNVNQWEWAYAIGGTAFSLCLGMVTLFAVLRVDNGAIHLMLTTTTAAYAASIAGRNASRPWVALGQLYFASVPMGLGLILHETLFYEVVGAALLIFMFGMTDITLAVRKTIINALETREKNKELADSFEQQANLFDGALKNMSHGLCMFDRDNKLLVWNPILCDILRCPPERLHKGESFQEVLELIHPADRDHFVFDGDLDKDRAKANFEHTIQLEDGRYVDVSSRQTSTGNRVLVFADVTEQKEAEAQIRHLALVDQLTGLMNRTSLQTSFRNLLKNNHSDQEIAVYFIDLDHFKNVNDTLGHPVGDDLLQQVAKRICDVCLDECEVGRMAGDEFLVMQKLTPHARTPEILSSQIIEALKQPFNVASHYVRIGASIGIAISPKDGEDAALLLKRADMALYAAKNMGRNRYEFFEQKMDQKAQQDRALELDIKYALEENQFRLAFQPIVDANTLEISAFETLIRWTHEKRGRVAPSVFIQVAEQTGQIIDIGRWVLSEAIKCASKWPTDTPIAINFSAVQFQDTDFPKYLKSQLRRFKVKPERVSLEITETAFFQDEMATLDILRQFRAIGVNISLDDFGTGFSSLSQLRTFPYHKIKIDGSFVRDLESNTSSKAVATAVAHIGQALNIRVVAECVESQEQMDYLREAGVSEIQGFYLCRPLNNEDTTSLLEIGKGKFDSDFLKQVKTRSENAAAQ
ncbi:putative bifunctional diguanylate cyclase/phosphodiesterase [Maritalea mediterranea]|uniref:EAL domain-containing protein n=1 Tax=Maritalea mediterranea TaxID=2909667 RepID=A0ABS9E5A9_9HYPH|nr:EAL domain-containing protein [Maritalea mediterranea]MCF4098050.1 EAL domain-containing protein [Maritalea mediterranea]